MEIIGFVWNEVLVNPMTNFLIILSNVLFDNYGLAIIAFTIVIRLITYPLTLRQFRTTRAMQAMQPRLQEIQKKYKDPRRRQQEMMKMYREVGFNPLGCAVPLLIQMPIWIALFRVIRNTLSDAPEELFGLSSRLYDWSFITGAVPLNRDFLFLDLGSPSLPLAILVGLTTFVQQKLSTARAISPSDRSASMNRTMLWMMPLMFAFFTVSVPSGLGLYWVVTSLFGIVAAYIYNGPENFRWRDLFTMEPMLAPRPAAAPDRQDQPSVTEEPAGEEPAAQAPDGPTRKRRSRRRRRRRADAAQRDAEQSKD